jgi:hypothetical protein
VRATRAWERGTTNRAAPGRVEPQRLGLARRAEGEEAGHEAIGTSSRARPLRAAVVVSAVRRRRRRGDGYGLSGHQPVARAGRGEERHGRWALAAAAPLALASAALAPTALASTALAFAALASTALAPTALASTALASAALASTALASAALASAALAPTAQQLPPHSFLRAVHARRGECAPACPRRAAHRDQRLGRRRGGVRSDARQTWAHGLQAEDCSRPTSGDAGRAWTVSPDPLLSCH